MHERKDKISHSRKEKIGGSLEGNPAEGSFLKELLVFLLKNKKWWLIPIVVILLAFGLLIALSSTGVAPFIYTLF